MKSWTVVTAYFDLAARKDAVPEIKERNDAHYLRHATATLALEQNLVVFCEPKSLDAIKAKRPAHLADRTRYVTMEFSEFPLYVHLDKVEQSRKGKWQYGDHNRNCPAYYLLCMARYAMLKKVITENPFESTHFAWLNICIERMGPSNVKYLPEVFSEFRDKFSTCYIDYIRKDEFPEVIDNGRCSMCSGFFTGNAYYMKLFCDKIEEKFLYYLDQGYGHADEQLYSPIYFDHPEIFEVYYGDYTEMVTNYHWIRERASEPLRLLIRRSFGARDFVTCRPACEKLWSSFKKGYAELQEWEVLHLIAIYRQCLVELGLPKELP
jgi:hypothetical protein